MPTAPTLTWVEDKASRAATIIRVGTRGTATYTKSYKVFGTDDDLTLHTEVSAQVMAALYYWQYPGSTVQLTIENYTVSYLGDKCWQVTLNYEKTGADDDEEPEPLRRTRSFDTGGGTRHMTQAIAERGYSQSGNAPNQKKAIGVDDDRVAGVDVVEPALQWSESYDVPAAYVTAAYIKSVSDATGTTNDATFRTFARGEVLFVGCSGTQEWDEKKGDGPWTLTYKFVRSPNAGSGETLPALEVGDIDNIEKRGHEYLWVRYESDVDSGTLLKKPRHVYVNQVYRETDFGQLGIGTS
jgi:hypothetical protein